MNKDVKVNARRDHWEFLDSLAQEAQEAARKGNMRDLFDTARKMTITPMYCGMPMRDKAGSIITSVQGQLVRRQHFEEVLNTESSLPLDREQTVPLPELQISVRPPSKR
jgi:hypothetical protein